MYSLWQDLSNGTMSWPWPWPLTYFKVKFVAERGTTILWICLFKLVLTSLRNKVPSFTCISSDCYLGLLQPLDLDSRIDWAEHSLFLQVQRSLVSIWKLFVLLIAQLSLKVGRLGPYTLGITSKREVPRDVRNLKVRRQVQERLVSTLEHMQVPKWDRTRCPEEKASSVGIPHPLQMFESRGQLGKKSKSVIRSRSVMVKNWCNVLSMEGVTVWLDACCRFNWPSLVDP